jgi:hypothetical protein
MCNIKFTHQSLLKLSIKLLILFCKINVIFYHTLPPLDDLITNFMAYEEFVSKSAPHYIVAFNLACNATKPSPLRMILLIHFQRSAFRNLGCTFMLTANSPYGTGTERPLQYDNHIIPLLQTHASYRQEDTIVP